MLHPSVLPQPLFRDICVLALFTSKRWDNCLFNLVDHSWQSLILLCDEFFSAPGISPHGWGALLLPHLRSHCCHSPGVQGKGEGWAHGKREVKFLPFAGQCLAEVHALGDQGGVDFTDCSHFWIYFWSMKMWDLQWKMLSFTFSACWQWGICWTQLLSKN